jgi:maleylacetate reductase
MARQGRVVFGAMDEVVFGQPAAAAIAAQADRLDAQRIFLMVSRTLNTKTEEIEKIRKALGARVVGTYDSMPPHTPRSAVIVAAEAARSANADLIVTVGGGSIIDGAKAVQLCLANGITTAEGMDLCRVVGGVVPPIKPPVVRQISVPTALSAGEFSNLAGVTDERTKTKELFRHPLVMPRAVVIDPAITVHTPQDLWTPTGIRAVDHCVEGLCSLESHPYGDAQAMQGLALLASGLPRVAADPGDLDARLDCQLGAWLSMGALSAGVPMGASHGIGYVLGAKHGVPHGHTSCVMLPAVMRWNRPANAARQALVATAMGEAGHDAADLLDRFIGGLGQPRRLADVGVSAAHFESIATAAMGTPWVPRNPRKIDGPAQVREILELAA